MFKNLFSKPKPDYSNPFSGNFPEPPATGAVKANLDGAEAEKNGDIDTAIMLYERNVAERFDGSHPYKRLATIYRKQKRYADEVRVLRTAIQVFSNIDRQDVHDKLIWFKERLEKAEQLWQQQNTN